jgi:hypothetical protein
MHLHPRHGLFPIAARVGLLKNSVDSLSGIATLRYLPEITLNVNHPLQKGVFYRVHVVPDGRDACRSGLRALVNLVFGIILVGWASPRIKLRHYATVFY